MSWNGCKKWDRAEEEEAAAELLHTNIHFNTFCGRLYAAFVIHPLLLVVVSGFALFSFEFLCVPVSPRVHGKTL